MAIKISPPAKPPIIKVGLLNFVALGPILSLIWVFSSIFISLSSFPVYQIFGSQQSAILLEIIKICIL